MGINFLHQAGVTCVSSGGGASPRMLLQREALYDIILCRYAVLLYADTIEQAASAIKKIVVGRLRPGGFLVLGETDNCGPDMLKSLGLEHYAPSRCHGIFWYNPGGGLSSPGAIFEDGEAKRKNSHGHDALAAYSTLSEYHCLGLGYSCLNPAHVLSETVCASVRVDLLLPACSCRWTRAGIAARILLPKKRGVKKCGILP